MFKWKAAGKPATFPPGRRSGYDAFSVWLKTWVWMRISRPFCSTGSKGYPVWKKKLKHCGGFMKKKNDEESLAKLVKLTKLLKQDKVKVQPLGAPRSTNKWRSQDPKFTS